MICLERQLRDPDDVPNDKAPRADNNSTDLFWVGLPVQSLLWELTGYVAAFYISAFSFVVLSRKKMQAGIQAIGYCFYV